MSRRPASRALSGARALARALAPAAPSAAHIREALDALGGAESEIDDDAFRGRIAALSAAALLNPTAARPACDALIADLEARLVPPPSPAREVAAPARPTPPRRRSSRFDTAEHKSLLSFFRDEAYEGLDRLGALLAGPAAPRPHELDETMRTTHTLKGAAGTVDLPLVAETIHILESVFAKLRDGRLEWSGAAQDALLDALDGVRTLVQRAEEPGLESRAETLKNHLRRLGSDIPLADEAAHTPPPSGERRGRERRYSEAPTPPRRPGARRSSHGLCRRAHL